MEEFLTKVVVDVENLNFHLYSNEGDSKTVNCDSAEQFVDVLTVCKNLCQPEHLTYAPGI